MNQEVQITLTLEVDVNKSKEDIKSFFRDMEETYTRTVSAKNRWQFPKITLVDIKEESEIYGTEIEANEQASLTDAITFAEWIDLDCVRNGLHKWKFRGDNFKNDYTTKELYYIFSGKKIV